MHEVKRITTIKKKKKTTSLLLGGLVHRNEIQDSSVSTDFGKQGNWFEKSTLPPLSVFPWSCSIAIHTPFCPFSCTGPQDSDHCAFLTAQSHKHGIELQTAVEDTTLQTNQLYCSCQHLTRFYFTTQEEQDSMPGEDRQIHLSYHQESIQCYFYSHFTENCEVEVCHQKTS